MADYQEIIGRIRLARKARDDARTELHGSLVENLVLDRRMARAGRGDIDQRDQRGRKPRPGRPDRSDEDRAPADSRRTQAGLQYATTRQDLAASIGELFINQSPQSLIEA